MTFSDSLHAVGAEGRHTTVGYTAGWMVTTTWEIVQTETTSCTISRLSVAHL